MHNACDEHWPSPLLSRRGALQAGAIGLALGTGQPVALRAWACLADAPKAKSVIFVFLTGGLSQLDSFDMKPDAPADVRGEFQPIATRTPEFRFANTCRFWRSDPTTTRWCARCRPPAAHMNQHVTCY